MKTFRVFVLDVFLVFPIMEDYTFTTNETLEQLAARLRGEGFKTDGESIWVMPGSILKIVELKE